MIKLLVVIFPFLLLHPLVNTGSLRETQKSYTRVRQAYAEKEKQVTRNLADHGIDRQNFRMYLRAFKTEKKIELWAKNANDSAFSLIREFPVCELSGVIGPKRRYKDLQVPEGFYHLSGLNPFSKYYLSIQVNYPNASDSVRGVKGHLGNHIFLHGGCMSSGCLAITDDKIKELYVYCVEAYNGGQEQIDITLYPAKLTDAKFQGLIKGYSKNKDKISLWTDLKLAYDLFEQKKCPPQVRFLPDGGHEIR